MVKTCNRFILNIIYNNIFNTIYVLHVLLKICLFFKKKYQINDNTVQLVYVGNRQSL